jgi:hypothetical protein
VRELSAVIDFLDASLWRHRVDHDWRRYYGEYEQRQTVHRNNVRLSHPADGRRAGTAHESRVLDWDDAIVGIPVENPRLRIGIDLNQDEADLLGSAAHAENMPISHYIKKVALKAAKRHR